MALFSRRKKSDDVESTRPAEAPAPEVPTDAVTDAAASVGISVSSYRGLGTTDTAAATDVPAATDSPAGTETPAPRAPARPRTPLPAEAPAATETIPGLRDNVVLREALAALPAPATAPDLLEVARQLMQGHLFLRVKGDARALLSEGKDIPLGVAAVGDKQFVLAYSSGAALRESIRADRETDTSAMGQPVLAVVRYVLAGPYAGLIIDNSSAPARAVLPRELLEKLLDQADPSLEVKTLLAGDRTQATGAAVAEALTRVKFWVAVNKSPEGRFGVAEARTDDGARLIEIYSHPLEVASLRRGDQAAPMTAEQLAGALRNDGDLGGIIVDPGGPWILLSRADLAPVLALGA
ncbi:MAG: SseB family protein [Microbacterium sp.]